MVWGDIIMEVIIASLVTGLLGIIAVIITNFFTDKKRHNEIDSKIGIVGNTTLSGQHENIEDKILSGKESLEKLSDKTLLKVSNIDKEIAISKNNYLNLDVNQREIKNNIDKLLYEWQTLVTENREIRKELETIKQQNNDLIQQNNDLQKSNGKLSKQVQLARRTLRNRNKEDEYDRMLEDEDEDEWDLEL